MLINRKGLNIIIDSEGFRSEPYLCPANIPTIGYGTTRYTNGKKVTLNDEPISEEQAFEMLKYHTDKVGEQLKKAIKVELTLNQFSALVSFVYNIGMFNFLKSSVYKAINRNPNDPEIADLLKRWNKTTVNGKKVVLNGLVKRREKESNLYFLT